MSTEPAIELGGINHLALVCRDMARTVEFYEGVLGMPLVKTVELPMGLGQHFFFDCGGGDLLAFFWFPEAPEPVPGVSGPAGRPDAPGVYVDGAKIASLGLRVRRGCSYHGLALNVDMDLEPFGRINPCGLLGTPVTQLADLASPVAIGEVRERLIEALAAVYGLSVCRSGSPGPG